MARARLAQNAPDTTCAAADEGRRARERHASVHAQGTARPKCTTDAPCGARSADVSLASGACLRAGGALVARWPPRRDIPFAARRRAVQAVSMQAINLFTLLSLMSLPLASATNHTDEGLSGGAIAGIIIGALAGVIIIGVLVYWYFFREMGSEAKSGDADADATASYAGGARDQRDLPMVALRVSGHDDDL